MKLRNGKINILVGHDSTTIKLIDGDAFLTFAEVTLTPEQLSAALSRQAHVPCEIELRALHNIGTRMEHKSFEFEIPEGLSRWGEEDSEELYRLAVEASPEGWVPDNYFGSQNTFFTTHGGKKYARVTIRRYVQITD